MKRYLVTLDVAYSEDVAVMAENEEEAKKKGLKMGAYKTGHPEEHLTVFEVQED